MFIIEFTLFFFSPRPLHEAVENGDVRLVRLLLSYGADPRLATYSGQSPLSLATDKQTRLLLEHHINDIQGHPGSASTWNFDESALNRKCPTRVFDFCLSVAYALASRVINSIRTAILGTGSPKTG